MYFKTLGVLIRQKALYCQQWHSHNGEIGIASFETPHNSIKVLLKTLSVSTVHKDQHNLKNCSIRFVSLKKRTDLHFAGSSADPARP